MVTAHGPRHLDEVDDLAAAGPREQVGLDDIANGLVGPRDVDADERDAIDLDLEGRLDLAAGCWDTNCCSSASARPMVNRPERVKPRTTMLGAKVPSVEVLRAARRVPGTRTGDHA